jgi:hypothetical protein
MPYGLVHKLTEDGNGFIMWSRDGRVECHLSRNVRKNLKFKIRPNMVLTMDFAEPDTDDEHSVDQNAPKTVTWISVYEKAVLLAVGDQDLLDAAKAEMKQVQVKVFTSLAKKHRSSRLCFVTASGEIYDNDEFDTSSRKSMTKLWDHIRDLHQRDIDNRVSSSSEKSQSESNLSMAALGEHLDNSIEDRLKKQSATVAELRNQIGIRMEAATNSGFGYLESAAVAVPVVRQLPTPSANLIAKLDARDERVKAAVAQLSTFSAESMQRNGFFQITDTAGNILRTMQQVRECHALTIRSGTESHQVRNHVLPARDPPNNNNNAVPQGNSSH